MSLTSFLTDSTFFVKCINDAKDMATAIRAPKIPRHVKNATW